MDIRINPVGFSVNPVLEEFINKKFSKLEKYHDGIMSIDVTLKLEKDDHLRCMLTSKGKTFSLKRMRKLLKKQWTSCTMY